MKNYSALVGILLLAPSLAFAQTRDTKGIARIEVTPASIKTDELRPFHLQATAYNSAGAVVPATFTFMSGNPAVANVVAGGFGNAWAVGSTTIAVSAIEAPNVVTTVPFNVVNAVARLEISPADVTVAPGSQTQYGLFAIWGDGTSENVSGVITSDNSNIASIDNMRILRGNALGTTALRVTINSPKKQWTGFTSVSVGEEAVKTVVDPTKADPKPVLEQILITPANASTSIGSILPYTATGKFSDGTKRVLAATWVSSIGVIDATGKFTSRAAGQGKVSATFATPSGPVSATTLVSVK